MQPIRCVTAVSILIAASGTAEENMRFAVASIKGGDPSVLRGSVEYRPETGVFSAKSATLEQLIGFAYGLRPHQIIGAPKWRDTATFTIQAKVDHPVPPEPEAREMFHHLVQSLLAERFQLVAHKEVRDERIYELVIDKAGSKLVENAAANGGIHMASGHLQGTAVPIFLLVNQLSRVLDRRVVDKTGLTGKYDFTLAWQPDTPGFVTDLSGVSIFTAIQEGLGLRIQPARGPVEFLVIEKVEKPNSN